MVPEAGLFCFAYLGRVGLERDMGVKFRQGQAYQFKRELAVLEKIKLKPQG